MRNQSDLKQELLVTLRALWEDDSFALNDSKRSARLRPEILRRLLGLVMTDDERAAELGLPEGCRVRESAKVIAAEKLECGKHIWIGENAIVDASGGLSIGEHTTIATGVFVWSHTSVLANLKGNNQPGNNWIRRSTTRIGSRTFIGGPSVVYPGVNIGDGVVVMPMSVVTRDVPDNVMVAGAPARIVRNIDAAWLSAETERLARAEQGG
jgi:acetyltransferase-like isoleucine patch superfamily enzyme